MHNKLMVIDNAIAVAGGRNIGDEYFAANPRFEFGDFDVFAAGPAVQRLSRSFDAYWNSALSIPAEALERPTPDALDAYRKELDEHSPRWPTAEYEVRAQESAIRSKRSSRARSPLVFAPSRCSTTAPTRPRRTATTSWTATSCATG